MLMSRVSLLREGRANVCGASVRLTDVQTELFRVASVFLTELSENNASIQAVPKMSKKRDCVARMVQLESDVKQKVVPKLRSRVADALLMGQRRKCVVLKIALNRLLWLVCARNIMTKAKVVSIHQEVLQNSAL